MINCLLIIRNRQRRRVYYWFKEKKKNLSFALFRYQTFPTLIFVTGSKRTFNSKRATDRQRIVGGVGVEVGIEYRSSHTVMHERLPASNRIRREMGVGVGGGEEEKTERDGCRIKRGERKGKERGTKTLERRNKERWEKRK